MLVAIADTHAVLWYTYSDSRLSVVARVFIEQAANNGDQIGISPITLAEIVYLIEKGRIAVESLTRLASALADSDSVFVESPFTVQIARTMARIDIAKVPDMPDRMISATALSLNVPLISRDAKIQVSGINTLW